MTSDDAQDITAAVEKEFAEEVAKTLPIFSMAPDFRRDFLMSRYFDIVNVAVNEDNVQRFSHSNPKLLQKT